jgi:hypothetical protein
VVSRPTFKHDTVLPVVKDGAAMALRGAFGGSNNLLEMLWLVCFRKRDFPLSLFRRRFAPVVPCRCSRARRKAYLDRKMSSFLAKATNLFLPGGYQPLRHHDRLRIGDERRCCEFHRTPGPGL